MRAVGLRTCRDRGRGPADRSISARSSSTLGPGTIADRSAGGWPSEATLRSRTPAVTGVCARYHGPIRRLSPLQPRVIGPTRGACGRVPTRFCGQCRRCDARKPMSRQHFSAGAQLKSVFHGSFPARKGQCDRIAPSPYAAVSVRTSRKSFRSAAAACRTPRTDPPRCGPAASVVAC